eukprot:SAG31_NODE_2055_length_6549_cov_100.814884_1_plen_141_part_00
MAESDAGAAWRAEQKALGLLSDSESEEEKEEEEDGPAQPEAALRLEPTNQSPLRGTATSHVDSQLAKTMATSPTSCAALWALVLQVLLTPGFIPITPNYSQLLPIHPNSSQFIPIHPDPSSGFIPIHPDSSRFIIRIHPD